jgi:hypothetical protein
MVVKNERKTDTRFKPGNKFGKGRPKKEYCIPDILRKVLAEPCEHNAEKGSNLEAICRTAVRLAVSGDKDARNWIADRTEGKAIERILAPAVYDEIIIE